MLQAIHQGHRTLVASSACLGGLGGAADIALALGLLPQRIFALDSDDETVPEPGELCVIIHDLRFEHAQALQAQGRCLAARASVLFVGMTPGVVQVGPLVQPGVAGCLQCWKSRVHNNDPRPQPAPAGEHRERPQPCLPMTAAAMAAAGRLIGAAASHAAPRSPPLLPPCTYLRVKTDDLSVTCHRFLDVPGCEHCLPGESPAADEGGPLRLQPRMKNQAGDKRIDNPKLTLEALRASFVGRHSGLVRHVFQNSASDLMPLFSAEMSVLHGKAVESGYGRADTFQASELIAILEAVERYAGGGPRGGRPTRRASYAQMRASQQPVIDPAVFILHGEDQFASPYFKLQPYSEDLEFDWCRAHSLRQDCSVWVPQQLAYYAIEDRPGRPVNRFLFDSSNGCSLGGCLEEAMLGGLYEVIERDAYLATWYTRIPPTRIASESLHDPRTTALIARAQADGYEIHLFDITTDIRIPAVWAMIVDPSDDAAVKSYCASGCSGRWEDAIYSALVEVTTSIGVYRRSMGRFRERAEAMLRDDAEVRAMADHVLLYSLPQTYERLHFLLGGPTTTLAERESVLPSLVERDLTQELRQQCAKVLAAATDILVVDQGFAGLQPLGLHCAKVLVPGLLPVTFGHQYRRISYQRLNQVARHKGIEMPAFSPQTVNPYPHNFP